MIPTTAHISFYRQLLTFLASIHHPVLYMRIGLLSLMLPLLLLAMPDKGKSQSEKVLKETIKSIKLFRKGDQTSVAVVRLGGMEELELHFDDLGGRPMNYFYTYELRNADWSAVNLSQMDYIKGFTQNRINQYRLASGTFTKYVHYQTNLPTSNCMPSRSGNYLLKVFENGDTSKLLFVKRMMVVEDRINIALDVRQPFASQHYTTHQKIIANVALGKLDVFNPAQQVKLVVIQNNRWDNAQMADVPTFIRDRAFEYNFEDKFIFEGGKEWRWADLRSFRFQSDRVGSVDYQPKSYEVYMRPDSLRPLQSYIYFRDINGMYVVESIENINPWWQTDYAKVHFTYMPIGNYDQFQDDDLYITGEMTGYTADAAAKMEWNPNLKVYETTLMLKNAYYNYYYATQPKRAAKTPLTILHTEGSVWQAENQYIAFFYYRDFGGRADQLIGWSQVNSLRFTNPGR